MNTLNHTLLTIEQEQKLICRIQHGDKRAEEELLCHNERLVYKIAHRYIVNAARDVEFDDLLQEGRLGLLHAAHKWSDTVAQKRKVRKFSTYASWWIFQYIRRYASRHRSGFSRSVELDDLSFSVHRVQSQLLETLRREPTSNEISKAGHFKLSKVRAILSTPALLNLDDKNHVTGDSEHELIPSLAPRLDALAESHVLCDSFLQSLEFKFPRHAQVIRMTYGLNDVHRIYSLAEIGDYLHITRERARQIKEEALKFMRKCISSDMKSIYIQENIK